eukprot:4713752-Pleurochrysis_carterae.AAC.1
MKCRVFWAKGSGQWKIQPARLTHPIIYCSLAGPSHSLHLTNVSPCVHHACLARMHSLSPP